MKKMQINNSLIGFNIVTLLFVLFFSSYAQENQDKLWKKAVLTAEKYNHWAPGIISEEEKTYNMDGELEESSFNRIKIFQTNNCELDVKLVKAISNGNDITPQSQKKFDKEKEKMNLQEEEENPFLPEVQKNIIVKKLEKDTTIQNKLCTAFEYTQTTSEAEWKGTAWLDKQSGTPMLVRYYLNSDLPEIDDIKLKKVNVTNYYEVNGNGVWYLKKINSVIIVKAKIFPFITFEGIVYSKVNLENYFNINVE